MQIPNAFPRPCGQPGRGRPQRGVALIVVLGMMSVVFVIAAITVRLTLMAERSARNDRDRQIAFQAAEAALEDAEIDIMGPNASPRRRCNVISRNLQGLFVPGCGNRTDDRTRGFCSANDAASPPLYTTIQFEKNDGDDDPARRYVKFGEFTGRTAGFKEPKDGGLSVLRPRYIVEVVPHLAAHVVVDSNPPERARAGEQAFLVTAVGYGGSVDTKVVLQALIYKPLNTPGCT